MNSSFKVESGVQLLARLTRRPSLSNLPPVLASGTCAGAVIEISGDVGSGKSLVVADAAARALLPRRLGGCGAGVVVFNTDGNFNLDWLLKNIRAEIETSLSCEDIQVELPESIVQEILPNLVTIDVFDSLQLLLSVENLETILTNNPNISLVIFDTLTAFYWSDQGVKLQKMDSYLKNILRIIQKVTKDYKITIIYTRPRYFGSKQDGVEILEACVKDPTQERINCRVQLSKIIKKNGENEIFEAITNMYDNTFTKYFKMDTNKIIYLDLMHE